ncbi:MAG: cell division protein FtsW, partial [Clostridia bacterium]|nr:cell division protein FtsW [Clostridia bacterium]
MNRIKSAIRHYLKNADLLLLGLALLASGLGLVLVFSATRSFGTTKFVVVQGAAIALGV